MKFISSILAGIALTLSLYADRAPVVLQKYTFTSSVTIPISNSDLQPSYLTAVQMSFAAETDNTVTIRHISAGVTNQLLAASATNMLTMVWYVPKPLFIRNGDSLVIANTDSSQATVALSLEKYKN